VIYVSGADYFFDVNYIIDDESIEYHSFILDDVKYEKIELLLIDKMTCGYCLTYIAADICDICGYRIDRDELMQMRVGTPNMKMFVIKCASFITGNIVEVPDKYTIDHYKHYRRAIYQCSEIDMQGLLTVNLGNSITQTIEQCLSMNLHGHYDIHVYSQFKVHISDERVILEFMQDERDLLVQSLLRTVFSRIDVAYKDTMISAPSFHGASSDDIIKRNLRTRGTDVSYLYKHTSTIGITKVWVRKY
jgi:hypothetical protein